MKNMGSVSKHEINSMEFESDSMESSSDEELPSLIPINLSPSLKHTSKMSEKNMGSSSDEELPCLLPVVSSTSTTSKKSEKSLKELLKEHHNLAESIKGDNISQNNIEQKIKKMNTDVHREEVKLESMEDTKKNFLYYVNDSLNFFNSRDVTPILCGYQNLSDKLTLLEKDMLSFVRVELESTLSSFLFTCHPYCISDCKSFVNFLLCNISVSSDAACINACYDKLITILKEHPDAMSLSFSSAEVFMFLFNYGIDVENCPILQRPGIKKHLSTPKNLGKNLNKIPDNWTFNLEVMLNALNKLMLTCDFKSKDICNILVCFLWMCLDDTLLKENLKFNLQECILSCLECLNADKWIINLIDVASIILRLFYSEEGNLHAIFQMTESIPSTTERSIYLRRQISFLVLKMESIDSNAKFDLNCKFNMDEFKTLIPVIIKKEPDESLYFASFVDLCVGHLNTTEETYLSLMNILKASESSMNEKACESKLVYLKIHTRLNLMIDTSIYKIKVETEESFEDWNDDTKQILDGNNLNFIQIKTEQTTDSCDALIPGNNHASNEFLMEVHSGQSGSESSERKQPEGTSASDIQSSFEACGKEFIPLINEEAVKQETEENMLPTKDAFAHTNIIVSSVTIPVITKVTSGGSINTDFESTVCHHSASELTLENGKSNIDDDNLSLEHSSHTSQKILPELSTIHSIADYADFHLQPCTVKIVDIMLHPQSIAISSNDIIEATKESGGDHNHKQKSKPQSTTILPNDIEEMSKESVEEESNIYKISDNSMNTSNRVEHFIESYCQPEINLRKNDFGNSYSVIDRSLNMNTADDNLINSNHMFENVPKSTISSGGKINLSASDISVSNIEPEAISTAKSFICSDDKDCLSEVTDNCILPREETLILNENLMVQSKTNISETFKCKPEQEPEIAFLKETTSPGKNVTNFPEAYFDNTLPKYIDNKVTKKVSDDDLIDDEVMIIEVKPSFKKSRLQPSGNTLKKSIYLDNEIKDPSLPHFSINKMQTKNSNEFASTSDANYNFSNIANNYKSLISPQFMSSFNKKKSSDEVIILSDGDSFSNIHNKNKCANSQCITPSNSKSTISIDYGEITILKEIKSTSKKSTDKINKKNTTVSQSSCVINLDIDENKIDTNSWKKNEAYNLNRLSYYEKLTQFKHSNQYKKSSCNIKHPQIRNKVDNFKLLNNEYSGAKNSTEHYESNNDDKSVIKDDFCPKAKILVLDDSMTNTAVDNEFQCIDSENDLLFNEDEKLNTDLTIKNISKNLSSSNSDANYYINKDLNVIECENKSIDAEIKNLLNFMVESVENTSKKCSSDKLSKLPKLSAKTISAKNLPKLSSSFYSPVQDKSVLKILHKKNYKKCKKQFPKRKMKAEIPSGKHTFRIHLPNSAMCNKSLQMTSIRKRKRILKNHKENCFTKSEKTLSSSKVQSSSKILNSYKRKLKTHAFCKYSPKKSLSNSMKNAKFKSYLTQTGLTFPQLLRDRLMPSYSKQSATPEQTICEEDSDIEILYTDPKKFSDSDCTIVFETEDLFIID